MWLGLMLSDIDQELIMYPEDYSTVSFLIQPLSHLCSARNLTQDLGMPGKLCAHWTTSSSAYILSYFQKASHLRKRYAIFFFLSWQLPSHHKLSLAIAIYAICMSIGPENPSESSCPEWSAWSLGKWNIWKYYQSMVYPSCVTTLSPGSIVAILLSVGSSTEASWNWPNGYKVLYVGQEDLMTCDCS